jgi:hypothetical protein
MGWTYQKVNSIGKKNIQVLESLLGDNKKWNKSHLWG